MTKQNQNSLDTITKLTSQANALTDQVNSLKSQVQTLTDKNQALNDYIKLKVPIDPNDPAEQEVEDIAYRVQSVINGTMHIGIIWADPAIVVQINPDSQVNSNFTDVFWNQAQEAMKNSKYTKVQKVTDKVLVFMKKEWYDAQGNSNLSNVASAHGLLRRSKTL